MEFTKAVDAAIEPLTRDISALCRIKSVEDEPQPGKPFGEGPAKALDAMLSMGQAMGFRTENFDHYVGHIEFGQGEETDRHFWTYRCGSRRRRLDSLWPPAAQPIPEL